MGASCYSSKLQSEEKGQFEETWDSDRKSRISFVKNWEYSTKKQKGSCTYSESQCCVTKVMGQSPSQTWTLSRIFEFSEKHSTRKKSISLFESYLADEVACNQQSQRKSLFNVYACVEYCNKTCNIIESHRPSLNQVFEKLSFSSVCSTWASSCQSFSSKYIPPPITEVIPGKLYLGCELRAFNEDELLNLGITHILSVTNHINPIKGIEREHFVMNDHGRTELNEVLNKVYPFMKRAQQPKKKLFVHCKLGQNRSATVVISFLMKSKGLTLYEAHKMLKERRPLVQVNRNYAKMLLQLDRELFGETSLPDDWMELDRVDINGAIFFKSEHLTFDQQQSFKVNQGLKLKRDQV